MLDEIRAYFAVVNTLPQAAEGKVEVGEYGAITLLNDQSIEECEASRKRIGVCFRTFVISDRQSCGYAFEVNCGGVSGRAGLMIVDEATGLVLLISQQPIGNLKNEAGEFFVIRYQPPLGEGLHQPCDLAEVTFVAESMPVILKGAL